MSRLGIGVALAILGNEWDGETACRIGEIFDDLNLPVEHCFYDGEDECLTAVLSNPAHEVFMTLDFFQDLSIAVCYGEYMCSGDMEVMNSCSATLDEIDTLVKSFKLVSGMDMTEYDAPDADM